MGVEAGFLVGYICTSYQVFACIAYPNVTCRMVAEAESTAPCVVATWRLLLKDIRFTVISVLADV